MKVSVIIPAYNEEKLLRRCIESLQNQTVNAHEIIVVDNNSTDTTPEIAKSCGVIIVTEMRQGIAYARDAGFQRATGDILARLDADCIAPKNWIEKISSYYEAFPSIENSSAITGMGYYTTKSEISARVLGTFASTCYQIGHRVLLGNVALFGSCMAFPRLWWERIQDEVCQDSDAVHEDIDLSVHLLKNGYSIKRLRGFYTYIDTRALHEPVRKTIWRYRIWLHSIYRHRKEQKKG